MGEYICGESIRRLRETAQLTQKDLAQAVGVTDKAVSKWETGRGLPDISLLDPLAKALGVSLAELLAGDRVVNANKAGNMMRSRFYVCPICGNVLFASGDASISCCGVTPLLTASSTLALPDSAPRYIISMPFSRSSVSSSGVFLRTSLAEP